MFPIKEKFHVVSAIAEKLNTKEGIMPGQGYHYAVTLLSARKLGVEISDPLIVGTLVLDAFNKSLGGRRFSHFAGGAGCVLPQYTELRQCKLQGFDSEFKKSYIVDPEISMRLFEAVNIHISESDYKDGLRCHLDADRSYDRFIQHVKFDFQYQSEDIVIDRTTGEKMSGSAFRGGIYYSYPRLDQLAMEQAGITAEDVEKTKTLLRSTLSPEHAEFICGYLKYDPVANQWEDTKFFKKEEMCELIDQSVDRVIKYLERNHRK